MAVVRVLKLMVQNFCQYFSDKSILYCGGFCEGFFLDLFPIDNLKFMGLCRMHIYRHQSPNVNSYVVEESRIPCKRRCLQHCVTSKLTRGNGSQKSWPYRIFKFIPLRGTNSSAVQLTYLSLKTMFCFVSKDQHLLMIIHHVAQCSNVARLSSFVAGMSFFKGPKSYICLPSSLICCVSPICCVPRYLVLSW